MRQLYNATDDDVGNNADDDTDNEGVFVVPEAVVVTERPTSILVRAHSIGDAWIPQSVVHDDSEVFSMRSAGPGKLVVMRWFANRKGWT